MFPGLRGNQPRGRGLPRRALVVSGLLSSLMELTSFIRSALRVALIASVPVAQAPASAAAQDDATREARVQGVVQLPDGGAAGSGEVQLRIVHPRLRGSLRDRRVPEVAIDTAGGFVLHPHGDGRYRLKVVVPGYPPILSSEFDVRGDEVQPPTLTVQVVEGGWVSGNALDAGAPLVGARVTTGSYLSPVGSLPSTDPQLTRTSSVTAADGSFSLGPLTPGAYSIELRHLGRTSVIEPVEVSAGGPVQLGKVVLEPPAPIVDRLIEGRVVLASGHMPAEATISIDGPDSVPQTRPLIDGRFRFGPLEESEYDLLVQAPGYRVLRQVVRPRSTPFSLRLEPLPSAVVRLLNEEGRTITPTSVKLRQVFGKGTPLLEARAHLVRSPGRVVVQALPGTYQLEVRIWSSLRLSRPFVLGEWAEGVVPVVGLEEGATVAGRTLGPDGNPVSASLEFLTEDLVPLGGWCPLPTSTVVGIAQADEAGDFLVPDVPEVRVMVLARAEGLAPSRTPLGVLRPGSVVQVGAIRLEEGGYAEGVVRLPDGRPLSGVEVGLRCEDEEWSAVSDSEGRVRLEHIPPGTAGVWTMSSHGAAAMKLRISNGRTSSFELVVRE